MTETQLAFKLSVEDSPAKTSQLQAGALASQASAAASGQSTPELLATYDPSTSSWRTSQLCLDGALSEFLEIWPRSGMIRNGVAWKLPQQGLRTSETVSGWLPTPGARDWKDLSRSGIAYAASRERHQPSLVTEAYIAGLGGQSLAGIYEWAMG